MNRLQQLYQEMIVDHNKNPKYFKILENPTHISHGKNPLCGDDYFVFWGDTAKTKNQKNV